MEQNRGNWYLLTGLILGLALGMIYAWVISPITEVDTHPNLLRDDYKDIYRSLISRAYQANSNLPRAEARLELIGDYDPALAGHLVGRNPLRRRHPKSAGASRFAQCHNHI